MPYYENVVIARQDISAQQAEGLSDHFAKLVEDKGGKVTKREYWGLRNLSYRIKKNRKGHYTQFNLDAPTEAIHELERQMRLHEDVLRYMTVRVDELDDEPSAQMQSRSGRDERPGRGRGDKGGDSKGGDKKSEGDKE